MGFFDPEDKRHEPTRALLEDDEATLATLDLARYAVANVAIGLGAPRPRWRRYSPRSSVLLTTAVSSPATAQPA